MLSLCFHFSFVFQLLIYIRCQDQEKQGKIIQPKYLATGSGLCSSLLSKVTEELTQELWDKVDAMFPGVYYLFCVYQTQPVNSPIFLYLKQRKEEKRERKNPWMLLRRIF